MFDIPIPANIYQLAVQAAQAHHVSVETFVGEAVKLRLKDDAEDAAIQAMFTSERLSHIEKAEAEIDAGEFFTAEQARSHFAQKKASWLQSHPR